MKYYEVVIKTKNRIVNTIVPGKKSMAEVLKDQKFEYDPEAVEVDGFLMVGDSLNKPLGDLPIAEKCRVSVQRPKKEHGREGS